MSWLSPCSVDTYEELYAYQYRPKPSENLRQSSGWALYDPLNEYGRMGVPNELWTHTTLNRNYEVCIYGVHVHTRTCTCTCMPHPLSMYRDNTLTDDV